MSWLVTALLAVLVFSSSALTAPLGYVKTLDDGTSVSVSEIVVTMIGPLVADGFYVESTDRSSGIKVISSESINVGDSLSIDGVLGTRDGERVIEASSIAVLSSENPIPEALGMSCKAILQEPDSIGKNIRICGTISGVDTAVPPQWFMLSDATGVPVKCKPGSGIAYNPAWSLVAVTGIASIEEEAGQRIPIILVDSTEGVRSYIGGITGKVAQSQSQVKTQILESPHPYLPNTNETWTITGPPGTTMIRCHFTKIELETGYDYLYVKDGNDNTIQSYSYTNPILDVWSLWVPGDTLTLHLTSDSGVQRYGFKVDKYEAQIGSTPVSGVTMTLMPGNITALTGADGSYSFANLSPGIYTVTPSLAGATFTPSTRTITVTDACLQDIYFLKN